MTRNVLAGIDGSGHALRTFGGVVECLAAGEDRELHLLDVQIPVESGHARP